MIERENMHSCLVTERQRVVRKNSLWFDMRFETYYFLNPQEFLSIRLNLSKYYISLLVSNDHLHRVINKLRKKTCEFDYSFHSSRFQFLESNVITNST